MCGRFVIHSAPEQIRDLFGVAEVPHYGAQYNVAVSQSTPIVRRKQNGEREIAYMRWGLIPHWSKDSRIAYQCFNARSETVHEKPAFRDAFEQNRCLVLTNGFYEWEKTSKKEKTPYFFHFKDDRLFAYAGLWSRNEQLGTAVETFSVVTTEANELLQRCHPRMPVILRPEDFQLWLDPGIKTREAVEHLFTPYTSEEMAVHPVHPRVNTVKNQGADLMQAYTPPPPVQGSLF